MANTIANAVDWYINKLNTSHLIPVNAAALMRDIASKQLSDGHFTPRPLTAENFTDAELDALYSLANSAKNGKAITSNTYEDVWNRLKEDGKVKGVFEYGLRNGNISEYTKPLRSISTTLGQAAVSPYEDDRRIKDIFDFNREYTPVVKMDDGKILAGEYGEKFDNLEQYIKNTRLPSDGGSMYSRFRNHAGRLGHSSKDPDDQKIHANISLKEIERKLGDRIGTLDMEKPWTKKDFLMKSIGAGALTGAPVGTAVGALIGALMMTSKRFRKKWYLHALLPPLAGAAIGAAIGGAGTGLAAHKAWKMFDKMPEKKAQDRSQSKPEGSPQSEKERKEKRRAAVVAALSYSLPLAALAAVGLGVAGKGYSIAKDLSSPMGVENIEAKEVDSVADLHPNWS